MSWTNELFLPHMCFCYFCVNIARKCLHIFLVLKSLVLETVTIFTRILKDVRIYMFVTVSFKKKKRIQHCFLNVNVHQRGGRKQHAD